MKRILKDKQLENTRLANSYGGWIYCTNCNKNIGYLCYVTYDKFNLEYTCNCDSNGKMQLEFEEECSSESNEKELITIKNRCCCPNDQNPLFTILDKNVKTYKASVVCNSCKNEFTKKKEV